ncbi:MAG TPA: adenosylcobalamin-dependent ribonucleoside-diphosphate reductase [Bacteroidia bacterium]|nr:adenosylcobalamin-dependent ribonucleoside-diphosphate reductase [Bacteroidia bacterium]
MKSNLSNNAIKVLNSRYLLKNAEGDIVESPDELFKRVASHIAKAELTYGNAADAKAWEEKFYALMCELKFMPNSPTLMNAGMPLGQLSACFVLPVEDSIESIFTTLKNTALIQQSGGGTGFNFSTLRPDGDFISSSSGNASGPVSFIKIFDAATQNIKQGGKRRGANMGIINIDHPDIEEFISVKREEGVLSNFNISVGIYDAFMIAVEQDAMWQLKHPGTGKLVKEIKARSLWNKIVENAWSSGDPGLVFLDTVNKTNPTPILGEITCTNPCGEVPLLSYEACNLGSINVSQFFIAESKQVDWKKLEESIFYSIRFLDNVIEMNNYIIPEIKALVTGNRKIGLGIMGWAELLIKMHIAYDSDKALQLAEELMKFINEKSKEASIDLAKQRGAFKNWDKSVYHPHTPIRNATRTSIAPTGTISIIAGTSSSIEPLFALAFHRENVLNNETMDDINPIFVQYLQQNNLYSEALIKQVAKTGTLAETDLPAEVKNLFKTSLEIEPKWHIQHQVAFQKHTDNAVSKTINMPTEATIKDIDNAYMFAWKQKAKGVTIFRYGSKQKQVLKSGIDNQDACHVCVS